MRNLTRHEKLNLLVRQIADKLNKATSQQEAKNKGLIFYYHLDYNSNYGGYRLEGVKIDSGACYGTFGGNGTEPRLKFSEMQMNLNTILYILNEKK